MVQVPCIKLCNGTPSQFHRDDSAYYTSQLSSLDSTIARIEYGFNVFVKRLPSDDRDLEETLGKVDDKAQVYTFLKRIVVALIPID